MPPSYRMLPPTVSGRSARAWMFATTPEERVRKPHGLDAYLVHQPGIHAIWSWWFLTGCDLYDDDSKEWGRLPAKKISPDKTHEFQCFALNPETGFFAKTEPSLGWDSTEIDTPSRVGKHVMTPCEFVHQEVLRDNDQANEILRLFVRAVCDGHTVCDADFARRNVQMLSATCDHFRQGKHDVS